MSPGDRVVPIEHGQGTWRTHGVFNVCACSCGEVAGRGVQGERRGGLLALHITPLWAKQAPPSFFGFPAGAALVQGPQGPAHRHRRHHGHQVRVGRAGGGGNERSVSPPYHHLCCSRRGQLLQLAWPPPHTPTRPPTPPAPPLRCACWTSLCSWLRGTRWCRAGPQATWARCACRRIGGRLGFKAAAGLASDCLGRFTSNRVLNAGAGPDVMLLSTHPTRPGRCCPPPPSPRSW
jgi:hypothetical protein